MFSESAEFYDRLYAWKDYRQEAASIQELLPESTRTVLDVGCGTGEHHGYLPFQVDGVDLNETFLAAARLKNPRGRYFQADMTDFDLGRRYDAVLCLFSSIAYAWRWDDLVRALSCLARHAAGPVLVEPWFPPEEFHPGRPHMLTIDEPELKVCRMSNSQRDDGVSVLQFHYLVSRPGELRHFEETHRLGLYTREQMLAAFAAAGLKATYQEGGPGGRGLYRA